ncbi:MAG: DUF2272 domain-containing protein [Pseudomonadota bacterium]
MSSALFISYRRDDTGHAAGRLHAELEQLYPQTSIFIDVHDIAPGVDFRTAIDQEVKKCKVLLACIGDQWLMNADETGARRIESPDDFVRIEIETALARGIPVVPVLVDGAAMPAEADLPTSLKPLAYRNALGLQHATFSSDVERLAHGLSHLDLDPQQGTEAAPPPPKSSSIKAKAMWVAALIACLAAGVFAGPALWDLGSGIFGTAGSPGPTHGAAGTPDRQKMVEIIKRSALEEVALFGNGSRTETEDPQFKRIADYWRTVGAEFDGRDQERSWSAAFVSFVMQEAGARGGFPYAVNHSRYFQHFVEAGPADDALFKALRPESASPRIGDILHYGRAPDAAAYGFDEARAAYLANGFYPSHGVIVVDIDPAGNTVTAVGGNVGDSVKTLTFSTDSKGRLNKRGSGDQALPWIGILRLASQ